MTYTIQQNIFSYQEIYVGKFWMWAVGHRLMKMILFNQVSLWFSNGFFFRTIALKMLLLGAILKKNWGSQGPQTTQISAPRPIPPPLEISFSAPLIEPYRYLAMFHNLIIPLNTMINSSWNLVWLEKAALKPLFISKDTRKWDILIFGNSAVLLGTWWFDWEKW